MGFFTELFSRPRPRYDGRVRSTLAIREQMSNRVTTFIEVVLNQELGEPFRRDAMKKPVRIAGVNESDFAPQRPVV